VSGGDDGGDGDGDGVCVRSVLAIKGGVCCVVKPSMVSISFFGINISCKKASGSVAAFDTKVKR
jgi:hypothetical protein